MTKHTLRIDIKAAQHERDWDNMLRYCRDTEAQETFSGFWLFDHFAPINGNVEGPCMDGWTLLAALAAATERVRLGLMVGCNGYRHPAVLAKIATTIDRVSNGRLEMGLGAGWFEAEYKMYGLPFPSAAQRIRELDEACQLIKLLWTEEVANFEGKYYTLTDARHEPKPVQKPHPPFTIGGSGEQLMLRLVARHADIYNGPSASVEQARHKNEVLDRHCEEIGRDPDDIRRSIQIYLQTPDDAGTIRERLEPFIELGVSHVCLGMPTAYYEGLVDWLAQEVGPLLAR
ncbi:MAG TPA: LLM class F420-dependent oxidoreductase [Chloroflexia bacterium]|nr:LLM class F420-dependent oxidoreductase [Chloroflexia bacterium]